jgi:hypothetical protein
MAKPKIKKNLVMPFSNAAMSVFKERNIRPGIMVLVVASSDTLMAKQSQL